MRLLLAAALLAFCTASPTSLRAQERVRTLRAGNHEFTLRHGGRQRSYIVHVPPGAAGALPVLLAFHGGGGNARGFQAYAELDAVADREHFLVVYPNGTGPFLNRLLTWNAGDNCCGYALRNKVNDLGFVATLLTDLENRTRIDRRRVYATGHSNGGIFAHRLGAERSGIIAAIAPVAGALDLRSFAPTRPMPVLHIHSVDDPRALYEGGLGPPFPGTNSRVMHQPVQAGLNRWIAANGCRATVDSMTSNQTREVDGRRVESIDLLHWSSCREGVEVQHWQLTGSGHGWPGKTATPVSEGFIGPQSKLLSAAEEVWKFVSRFRLPE
jgi:polyhydroxybutyrate depolymerase